MNPFICRTIHFPRWFLLPSLHSASAGESEGLYGVYIKLQTKRVRLLGRSRKTTSIALLEGGSCFSALSSVVWTFHFEKNDAIEHGDIWCYHFLMNTRKCDNTFICCSTTANVLAVTEISKEGKYVAISFYVQLRTAKHGFQSAILVFFGRPGQNVMKLCRGYQISYSLFFWCV